jgi:pyridoxal phosphate enzyme (YggS family)
MSTLSCRFNGIIERIKAAEVRSGRPPGTVRLVAVSKAHPPDILREAVSLGVEVFGENRIQEARAKAAHLPSRIQWHFLGHLQRNKLRQALPLFEMFHGVDSLQIATDMDRVAAETGHFPKVLLEVNVAGEASKFGFSEDRLTQELEQILALPRLQVLGLMAIPPFFEEPEDSRPFFRKLAALRGALQDRFGVSLPELSMGMSGDFEVAIEEGATWVRVGTALFGARSGKQWRGDSIQTDFEG